MHAQVNTGEPDQQYEDAKQRDKRPFHTLVLKCLVNEVNQQPVKSHAHKGMTTGKAQPFCFMQEWYIGSWPVKKIFQDEHERQAAECNRGDLDGIPFML